MSPQEKKSQNSTSKGGDGSNKNPYHPSANVYKLQVARQNAEKQFNRRTRRALAKFIKKEERKSKDPRTVRMSPLLARPSGCCFLGSRALEVHGSVNDVMMAMIIDSGSDITLISEKTLRGMMHNPKIRKGQRIQLIQVTGRTVIDGYVTVNLNFETEEGPVEFEVDAYVVKNMTSPFILGNDYADQYSLSILREGGNTQLKFGDTGRCITVHNSLSAGEGLRDSEGRAFRVLADTAEGGRGRNKDKVHRMKKHSRQRQRKRKTERTITVAEEMIIPPESSKFVRVEIAQIRGDKSSDVFLERCVFTNSNVEDTYGFGDTLLDGTNPRVCISNFSSQAVRVHKGMMLGIGMLPCRALMSTGQLSQSELNRINSYSTLIQSLLAADPKMVKEREETDRSTLAQPVVGGPKTAELPEEEVSREEWVGKIDISKELSTEQEERIRKVILRNAASFALDGQLGQYPEEVDIPLLPGTKPISIPPYQASPASKEVIDKQMDTWLKLEVIEPSRSPWAAPVFIVYRNHKPRMVIDLRRLNDRVVADEFPLPRQEEILQSLSGSRYLSTLDALAGFTQLSVKEADRDKLAFRTHRGLFQFKRMPFGYRNGPAVFQRVMQGVLAPFLWIFALVYIDDIVIFSKTFEEHISHVDQVLGAIAKARITLSPEKCHFAYESLLLLGQKVSRLGLSTHQEKVDAILQLEEPRNVHELQVFLGMMVYFSAYIPYYAWIVHPLFQLLKGKNAWRWEEEESEAYRLCKQVLTQAPLRAHAMPGKPYRVYSDACDYALAAILQQVQPILVRDLKGTKVYERLERAYEAKEPVPILATHLTRENSDIPTNDQWGSSLDETTVHVERVIAYWSRVLQSAERNYSPTEREALALKEGLVKFQATLEGEEIYAVTDHAALTWSKTFQNVNRRLLTWGLIFSAFPNLRIIHRAGRVHSNVDPLSRLRRRIPDQTNPVEQSKTSLQLGTTEDPLKNIYDELGERFENKLLKVASCFVRQEISEFTSADEKELRVELPDHVEEQSGADLGYQTSRSYNVVIALEEAEKDRWRKEYRKDAFTKSIMEEIEAEGKRGEVAERRFRRREDGMLMFCDNEGNTRLCVPKGMVPEVMKEVHDGRTEAAHAGYHKTYNRISATYYWPRMSRSIKELVRTCDVCQKSKPRKHAPMGLLQPIPIPSQPFEVISMDFISELPVTPEGFDAVLVVVDKLTKYAITIPTTTKVTESETAILLFEHVFTKFGLPRQIISDRDPRWRGVFWAEVCRLMGMKRALTTAYHPQADGQTEALNHYLEVAVRCYVERLDNRDQWSKLLTSLTFAYNCTPHSSTERTPSFLLRGYQPVTGSTLIHGSESIDRTLARTGGDECSDDEALRIAEEFRAEWRAAQESLTLAQIRQEKGYNRGRKDVEFEEGDFVLLNRETLGLNRNVTGTGKKLIPKFEGPFEVQEKISRLTYRIRLPASYAIHPVININHLERYNESPDEFGERMIIPKQRPDFDKMAEYEVDRIIGERWRKTRHGKRQRQYQIRWKGYGPEDDTWELRNNLRNAPEIIRTWEKERAGTRRISQKLE